MRGCAQRLCRQYKDCVGGQRGARVCSCQRVNMPAKLLAACHTAQSPPAQFKEFPSYLLLLCNPRNALDLQRFPFKFLLASDASSNRNSFVPGGETLLRTVCLTHTVRSKNVPRDGESKSPFPPHCSSHGTCQDLIPCAHPLLARVQGRGGRRCGWC